MVLQEQQCYKNKFLCSWFSALCAKEFSISGQETSLVSKLMIVFDYCVNVLSRLRETQHHCTVLKTEADHTKAHTYTCHNLHTAIKT